MTTKITAGADRKALLAKLLRKKTKSYQFPLSYGQQALWVIHRNHPLNLAYNMAWAVQFHGTLQVSVLRQSLQNLVDRHPALRSTITLIEGEPMQRVQPTGHYVWHEQEVLGESDETVLSLLQTAYEQPFDLSKDAVLRAELVQSGDEKYTLLLVMHHIFGDAESMNILGKELLTLYRANLHGQKAELPELPVSYPEFVRNEKKMLDSPEGKKMLAYWQQTLGKEVPLLQLPLDRPRPAEQTYNGASVSFTLSSELSQQLKQLAKQQNITLFPLFLSAVQIFLQRYTGQTDIWVGSPSSVSRHHPQFSDIIGCIANSVVLRTQIKEPDTISSQTVLTANRQQVLDAIAHAAYPFMLLVRAIKPERNLSYSPLFQVMLDFKGSSFFSLDIEKIEELEMTRIDFPQMKGQFDLTFNILEGDCFDCILYYNQDIFVPATIERMSQHMQILLEGMATQPELPIAQLPLLTSMEIKEIQSWSITCTLSQTVLERVASTLKIDTAACANAQIYLLDAQQQPVPCGIAGEIYLGSLDNLTQPSCTVELFGNMQSLYQTGVRAKWLPDGTLEYIASTEAEAQSNAKLDTHKSSYVYPRDDTEFRLASLWEELLDVSPISVEDDFFQIGGDSLLGIRLLFNIEKEFGISLQIQTLIQNKTLEQLSCVLRENRKPPEWSPLVCLQSDGDKTPLFFVHASGGTAFDYFEISMFMGDERPFYAIQPQGTEIGDEFHPSIEEMAADYVASVRAVQPHGPYLLGGWSFGATVAFEMARIFEQEGETVGLVLMVDTPEPAADVCKQDDFEFLMDRLPHYYGVTLDDLDTQDSTEAKIAYLLKEVKLSGLFTPDIDQTYAYHWFDMYKHHNRIVASYKPAGPIQANIVFFKPSEKIPFDAQMGNPSVVWKQFAQGHYEVYDAPGNHFNMISPINTPALVEKMKEYIEAQYENCPQVKQVISV